jgi:hypothetical protein
MEVSGPLHVPVALLPEKNPWYPLYRRLGGTQSRSGRGEGKISLPLPGLEPAIIQPSAITTELYRLLILLYF